VAPSDVGCMPGLHGGQGSLGPSNGRGTAPRTSLRHSCGSIHLYVLYVYTTRISIVVVVFVVVVCVVVVIVKGTTDERQSRPTFVGVVELPDKIGRQNR